MSDKNHGEEKLIVGKDSSQRSFSERMLYHWEHSEKTGWLYKGVSISILLFSWTIGAVYSSIQKDVLIFLFLQNIIVTIVFFKCFIYKNNSNKILIFSYLLSLAIFLIFYFEYHITDSVNLNLKMKRAFLISSVFYFFISSLVSFNNVFYIYNLYLKNIAHVKQTLNTPNFNVAIFNICLFVLLLFLWFQAFLGGDVFSYAVSFFFLSVIPFSASIIIVKTIKNLKKGA